MSDQNDHDASVTHSQLAAKLLRDAAAFFRTLGEENPPLAEQMAENASVFVKVGDLVEKDPFGVLEDPSSSGDNRRSETFIKRPDWFQFLMKELGIREPGDRLEFSNLYNTISWHAIDLDSIPSLIPGIEKDTTEADRALLRSASLTYCKPGFFPDSRLIHAVTEESDALFLEYPKTVVGDDSRAFVPISRATHYIGDAIKESHFVIDGFEYDFFLFFMHALHNDGNKFRLLNGYLLKYVRNFLERNGNSDVAQKIYGPRFVRFSGEGACVYRACIVYQDHLFESSFKLHYDGLVEMIDDEPLATDFDKLLQGLSG